MKYKRISTQKLNKIFLCFCEDVTATACAKIVGVNRNTVNTYYNRIRELIFQELLKEAGKEFGEFECDESYFGAKRVCGKRGRGAAGKTPVFGLLKRGEKVYVKVVENCSRESLMPIIQGLTLSGSTIYTDGWKAYDGLILNGYEHHRVFHHENEFARGKSLSQRHRELLVVREGAACEAQRLRFRQICATLEGVRMAVQPQARGLAAFG